MFISKSYPFFIPTFMTFILRYLPFTCGVHTVLNTQRQICFGKILTVSQDPPPCDLSLPCYLDASHAEWCSALHRMPPPAFPSGADIAPYLASCSSPDDYTVCNFKLNYNIYIL